MAPRTQKTNRREWGKNLRQERIIDIAQELFSSLGYESTTMDGVARNAGYVKRTIYLYFRDKDDLFAAIVLRGLRRLNRMFQEAFDRCTGGLARMEGMADAYFAFYREDPVTFDFVILFDYKNRYYHRQTDPAEDRPFVIECQRLGDLNADLAIEAIRQAVDEGAVRTTLTPLQLLLVVWGELSGVMRMIATREAHFEKVYGVTAETLFEGFKAHMQRSLT
ncbi:MAG: TetR/AcrR family transcriptional regulator [Spirochaetes bacterium]|nr:TetR/AcrR family transcriptional regulator [Spirochaetota bacterium]